MKKDYLYNPLRPRDHLIPFSSKSHVSLKKKSATTTAASTTSAQPVALSQLQADFRQSNSQLPLSHFEPTFDDCYTPDLVLDDSVRAMGGVNPNSVIIGLGQSAVSAALETEPIIAANASMSASAEKLEKLGAILEAKLIQTCF
jgi:hypothetical protein